MIDQLSEELGNDGSKGIHLDQKRIVTAYAVEFSMPGVRANYREAFRQRRLLMAWEKDIGSDANHEGAFQFESFKSCLERAAMLGKIKQI